MRAPGQGAGVGHGLGGALVGPDRGHLRAHERPVGHVVVHERGRRRVAGQLGVPAEERSPQLRRPEALEVHRQERGVVEPVDVPEPVVELQAVQRPGPVVEAEHVVGHQVAVPVDRAAGGDPMVEERASSGQEPQGEPLDLVHEHRVQGGVEVGADLLEAGLPAGAEHRQRGLGVDLRPPRRALVGGGELVREVPEVVAHVDTAGDERGQATVLGHPPHHHHRLVTAVRQRQVGHPEVDVGGEAAVELDLPPAGPGPRLG
jgi:hypothetical protein